MAIKRNKKDIAERKNKIINYLEGNTSNRIVYLMGHNDYIKDKKIDYRIYSIICLKSKFDPIKKENYIYNSEIKINEIGEIVGASPQTIRNKIKYMRENGLLIPKNTTGGMAYTVNVSIENNHFHKTTKNILIDLLGFNNSELIKTFVLLKSLCYKTCKEISRDFITDKLGLAQNEKTRAKISKYTEILQDMELINKTRKYKTVWSEEAKRELPKTIIVYNISNKHYEEIQSIKEHQQEQQEQSQQEQEQQEFIKEQKDRLLNIAVETIKEIEEQYIFFRDADFNKMATSLLNSYIQDMEFLNNTDEYIKNDYKNKLVTNIKGL